MFSKAVVSSSANRWIYRVLGERIIPLSVWSRGIPCEPVCQTTEAAKWRKPDGPVVKGGSTLLQLSALINTVDLLLPIVCSGGTSKHWVLKRGNKYSKCSKMGFCVAPWRSICIVILSISTALIHLHCEKVSPCVIQGLRVYRVTWASCCATRGGENVRFVLCYCQNLT